MTQTSLKIDIPSPDEDFQKALKFFIAIDEEEYNTKNVVTFPQKYQDKNKFLQEFKELDDLQKLSWFDHHLKDAYIQYTKRDRADAARKNILWSLMLCRQFNISLGSRDYQLMKMIKHLWYQQSQNQSQSVKDKLKQIMINKLGDKQVLVSNYIRQSPNPNLKRSGMCGCAGNCMIM